MKGKRKLTIWVLILVAMVTLFFPEMEGTYQAAGMATSYTNAREFFNSTGLSNGKHIDIKDGEIYFATKGKLAHTYASDYHTYYASRGFDVTLTGGDASVTFAVKIGVSLEEVPGSADQDEQGYHYQLFKISRTKLEELAKNADPVNAEKVLSAETFWVCLDTIIVRRYAGMEGTIAEDGKGGLIVTSPNNNYTWVWRLKDKNQLVNAQSVYGGHKFQEYIAIEDKLENYNLDVYYAVDGLPELSANSSTHVTVADGWRTANGDVDKDGIVNKYVLCEGGKPKIDSSRLVNTMTILNPLTSGPMISKTGYHLDKEATGKEWITSDGRTFMAGGSYSPKDLESSAGTSDATICLYANWKPNTYEIYYNANGGDGAMFKTYATYDKAVSLTGNMFSRLGYTFKGWATSPTGPVAYVNGQLVFNLTAENGGKVILYAVWEKNIYKITLDNQGAMTPGATAFYEKYADGNYETKECTTKITQIIKPAKTGYIFNGYFTNKAGSGECHVDADGNITSTSTTFKTNTTLYANWTANTYTIQYNANGGIGTIADTEATYDKELSLRSNTFERTGHDFIGWAASENGAVVYKDKEYVKNLTATNGAKVILYAVWEPVTPLITLNPQEGSGGTESFYEKYEIGFYSNNLFYDVISKITIPIRTGYDFKGYFADNTNSGSALIDAAGNILAKNTAFLQDTTLFARWLAKTFTITFDKQGGSYGTDSVIATYNQWIPEAQAPVKAGFEFQGYYTAANGAGTLYYDAFMNPQVVYKSVTDTTLYAYWVDSIAPEIVLNVSSNTWTNQQVTLEAIARDNGSGLSSVEIFQVSDDGSLTTVVKAVDLNGATSKNLTYVNTTEGVIRYKAVATDMKGNISESYNTVYYDKTAPSGEVVQFIVDGSTIYIDVNVTDINPGN